MKRLYLCWSSYKSPSVIKRNNEYSIIREDMSLDMTPYGADGRVAIEVIENSRGIGEFYSWANDLPIIRKSRVIGLVNTLFAHRLIKLVFEEHDRRIVEIEGLDKKSRLTGKASIIRIDNESIYSYKEEGMVRMESFTNRLQLSFNSFDDMARLVAALGETDPGKGDSYTGEIIKIVKLNEDKSCGHVKEDDLRYWSFHDRLFDRKTRSWGDNIIRSGSYRFLPEPAPRSPSEIGSSPTEYHYTNDLVPPHSRRIGAESEDITRRELCNVLDRAFMNIRVQSSSGSEKYRERRIHRPYPSAGGINELSFFVLSEAKGNEGRSYILNKYSPERQELDECGDSGRNGYLIADYVKRCWQTESPPRYILMIAGDYSMIGYKYENISYRLMLLNAGCASLRFYDACRSMGFSCCCAGCGPSDLIREILPQGAELTPIMEIGFGRGA